MKEVTGDIWDFHPRHFIVIPTNGAVNKNGECVMGRGLALQAKKRFPLLPLQVGKMLGKYGNKVFCFTQLRLYTFPVKHNWWEKADPQLILKSMDELKIRVGSMDKVYLPRVGCGNGQLDWMMVRPVLAELDDRFTVVSLWK